MKQMVLEYVSVQLVLSFVQFFYPTDANISYLEENELTYSKPASPVEDLEFDTLLEMAKRQQSVE